MLPSPYYQDDNVTLYHGDCLDIIPALDLDAVTVITDPPYGIDYQSNFAIAGPTERLKGDGDANTRDAAIAAWGDIPSAVFGRWDVRRPPCSHRLIWDKGDTPGMGDLTMPWGQSEEEIYVSGKGWSGKRRSNVVRFKAYASRDVERYGHPTPKPVSLMRHLVEYSPPGTLILDPFAGSGTTLRAAKDLGRQAIGVEIEQSYCDMIVRRLAQEVLF